MGHRMHEIFLPEKKYNNYKIHESEEKIIKNLSKINIFVGANNSGKSRMLRSLFEEEKYIFTPTDSILTEINEEIINFKETLINVLEQNGIEQFGRLTKETVRELIPLKFINDSKDETDTFLTPRTHQEFVYEIIQNAKNIQSDASIIYSSHFRNQLSDSHFKAIKKSLKEIAESSEVKLNNFFKESFYDFKRVYIPTLRGLRGLDDLNINYYLDRTQRDYFSGNQKLEIFTGLGLYDEIKNLLLGNLTEREIVTDFQKFIGDSFFDGEDVALIPNINSDVLYVKIGTEKEYPIFNLGDGIQSLIILIFPLFKHRGENLTLFIEEPELYLHPGMQRKFLEIITHEKFRDYQYFLTTHSNHFLDMTLDMDKMSVYLFNKQLENIDSREKDANFVIENISNEKNNVLRMLGVKNSSVFLSNCTIWVEGITDRYYIRHFLNLYQKTLTNKPFYKEDIHYSFVEYSGNNITHWSFLDEDESEDEKVFKSINESRVCGTLFLITDKDTKKKEVRQSKLAKALGERYYCLDCREIENILTFETLKRVIATYEKVEVNDLKFNVKITDKSYKNKPLGDFISKVIKDKKRKGKYESASGAISDKLAFSRKAISEIKSYEDLSEEAKKISVKLYEFISANNR